MFRAFVENFHSRHPACRRFITLGQQRTGSNLLQSYLCSHPAALAFGEIFTSLGNHQWGHALLQKHRPVPDSVSKETLIAERNADPVGFLERYVFKPHPRGIKAVGFKIFYQHCSEDENSRHVWEWLRVRNDIAVIHLKRANPLRTLASKRLANQTGVWWVYEESPPAGEDQRVTLDVADCEKFFEATAFWERKFDFLFRHHPLRTVFYEDLDRDPAREMSAVQRFLGLREMPLQTTFKKQNAHALPSMIQNFVELRERFRQTPWTEYFADEP